jgi:hypothetical protein
LDCDCDTVAVLELTEAVMLMLLDPLNVEDRVCEMDRARLCDSLLDFDRDLVAVLVRDMVAERRKVCD